MYIRLIELDFLPLLPEMDSAGGDATDEPDQKYGNGIQHFSPALAKEFPASAS
jgi:hypothetical protein